MTLIDNMRRPPTMIPGVASSHTVKDGANFYRRLYRPHSKRWVTVGVWIFFIVIPVLVILFILFFQIIRFLKG